MNNCLICTEQQYIFYKLTLQVWDMLVKINTIMLDRYRLCNSMLNVGGIMIGGSLPWKRHRVVFFLHETLYFTEVFKKRRVKNKMLIKLQRCEYSVALNFNF